MRSRFDDDGSGPNISEVVAEVSDALRGNVRRFGPLLAVVLLVAVVVTGVYSVGPGEQGVVRRFGREHRTAAPGLHYAIPLVEAVNVVNIVNPSFSQPCWRNFGVRNPRTAHTARRNRE